MAGKPKACVWAKVPGTSLGHLRSPGSHPTVMLEQLLHEGSRADTRAKDSRAPGALHEQGHQQGVIQALVQSFLKHAWCSPLPGGLSQTRPGRGVVKAGSAAVQAVTAQICHDSPQFLISNMRTLTALATGHLRGWLLKPPMKPFPLQNSCQWSLHTRH